MKLTAIMDCVVRNSSNSKTTKNEFDQNIRSECAPVRLSPESKEWLSLKDVPAYLQFNPYVLTGYRPQLTTWGCIRSLSYLHNETINILSHGIPLLYAIWNIPYLLPWETTSVPVLPYMHAAATVSPWLGSSLYHLFMNHQSGPKTYAKLLQWDVVGVWITQTFGALTTIYAAVYCLHGMVQYTILTFYIMLACHALYGSVFANGPWARRNSFLWMLLVRLVILLFRFTPFGGGHPEALNDVILQDLWTIFGAVVSATQVPERWLPGKFDLGFNSHNIMHCIVVLAAAHMHWATEKDLVETGGQLAHVFSRRMPWNAFRQVFTHEIKTIGGTESEWKRKGRQVFHFDAAPRNVPRDLEYSVVETILPTQE